MKKIGFKSLRQRILTGFLAVVLLTAVIIGYNVIRMRETNRQAEALIEQEMPVLIVNEQLAINILERMHLLNSYVLYDANAYVKTFNNGRESSTVRKDLESGYEAVQSGAKQMEATEKMFEQIDEVVNQSASGIDTISLALNDMSNRSKQLLSKVEEIAAISEQSAAGVEETSASVQEVSGSMNNITAGAIELSDLVVKMKRIVERFKI